MAVVCSMTGLYPGKFIFKKTILPISAGQAVCPLPTTEIIFLWGFFWLDVNRKYNWESITTIIEIFCYNTHCQSLNNLLSYVCFKSKHWITLDKIKPSDLNYAFSTDCQYTSACQIWKRGIFAKRFERRFVSCILANQSINNILKYKILKYFVWTIIKHLQLLRSGSI